MVYTMERFVTKMSVKKTILHQSNGKIFSFSALNGNYYSGVRAEDPWVVPIHSCMWFQQIL